MNGRESQIVFRCDASPSIGVGHVMRCLALADAFIDRDCTVAFAMTRDSVAHLPARFPATHRKIVLAGCAEDDEATEIADAIGQSRLTIVDHYGRGRAFEAACRPFSECVLSWEDVANRDHDCDFLLDTCATTSDRYRRLIPETAQMLLGPRFAPLRSEFLALRPQALADRDGARVGRILVSFGGGDTAKAVILALDAIEKAGLDVVVDIVGSAGTANAVKTSRSVGTNVFFHIDAMNIAQLMVEADVAVGGGGSTSWERCCLGLPSIVVSIAENQQAIAAALAEAGAAVDLGPIAACSVASLAGAIGALVHDPAQRGTMSAAAAGLVDGKGGGRIAEAVGL